MPGDEDYDAGEWDDDDDEFEGFEIDDGLDIGFEHESDAVWPILEELGLIGQNEIHDDVDDEPRLAGKHDPRWEVKRYPFAVIHACVNNPSFEPARRRGRGPFRCPICDAEITEPEVKALADEALGKDSIYNPFSSSYFEADLTELMLPKTSSRSRKPKKLGHAAKPAQTKSTDQSKASVPQKQPAIPSQANEDSITSTDSDLERPRPEANPVEPSQKQEKLFTRMLREVGYSVGLGRAQQARDERSSDRDASPVDPLLHYLLWFAETGASISLTFNMSGQLISGLLVSPGQFFGALAKFIEQTNGGGDGSESGDSSLQSIHGNSKVSR